MNSLYACHGVEKETSGHDPQTSHTNRNPTPNQEVQHVRTVIPIAWAIELDHLVADLRIPKAEAFREAIALYLRYHGHGQDIPAPSPPIVRCH